MTVQAENVQSDLNYQWKLVGLPSDFQKSFRQTLKTLLPLDISTWRNEKIATIIFN